jgi:hypothetical protein
MRRHDARQGSVDSGTAFVADHSGFIAKRALGRLRVNPIGERGSKQRPPSSPDAAGGKTSPTPRRFLRN